jgi:hypothetical protein
MTPHPRAPEGGAAQGCRSPPRASGIADPHTPHNNAMKGGWGQMCTSYLAAKRIKHFVEAYGQRPP